MKARFFKNEQFDFETRLLLGGAYYGVGDVGEIHATSERIKDGDYEGWFREWKATGDRVLAIAEVCEAAGRPVSARRAYLRVSAYLFSATGTLEGTDEPDRFLDVWRAHRRAWERYCALSDPPIETIAIPYEGKELVGFVFRPAEAEGLLPTLILNNGSDGPVHAMWAQGGAAAVERGYLAVTFDGPGQGQALFEQGIPFRPDWEAVITPVVDYLLSRDDVDPNRIALHGVSQAGYWVPRAVAFEKRIAAAVADPGAMDVSTSWLQHLPKSLVKMLDEGDKRDAFNRDLKIGLLFTGKVARRGLAFRMRPYGTNDPFEVFRAVRAYNLRDVVGKIECPLLVTDPEDEQFWPGQSQDLYDALTGPKQIVRFTAAEGANWHCEPMALGLRDQRIFDWLDEALAS
jgi:fermentation-respiration switch protein FrsA (DUF1100 family)